MMIWDFWTRVFYGKDTGDASIAHRQLGLNMTISAQCHEQNHKSVILKAWTSHSDLCLRLLKRHQSGKYNTLNVIEQHSRKFSPQQCFPSLLHLSDTQTDKEQIQSASPPHSQQLTPVDPSPSHCSQADIIINQINSTSLGCFQMSFSLLFKSVVFKLF